MGSPDPQEVEAKGVMEGIKWLSELDLRRVIIELDCKAVMDDIRGVCNFVTEFDSILSSCNSLLSNLQNYIVSFIRRQANIVAHNLARASRQYANSQIFDCSPICITTLILARCYKFSFVNK